MKHKFVRIIEVEVLEPYSLRLKYDDGFENVVNLESILEGDVFEPLKDINEFRKVSIDQEVGTIIWPCGADFDPDTLYHWSSIKSESSDKAA